MSRKRYAGSKPPPKTPPSEDEPEAAASDDSSETEHIEDEGEPEGSNFA